MPNQVEVMMSMASETSVVPDVSAANELLKHSRDQSPSNANQAVAAAFESTTNPITGPDLTQSRMEDPRETPAAVADDTVETAAEELIKSAVTGVAAGPDEDLNTAREKVRRRLCQCRLVSFVLTVGG